MEHTCNYAMVATKKTFKQRRTWGPESVCVEGGSSFRSRPESARQAFAVDRKVVVQASK